MEVTQEYLKKHLPRGSGFDYVWEISETRDKFVCRSSHTVYSEHGYKEGRVDFFVKVNKSDSEDFTLHFSGDRSYYLSKKHLLREYMEDTIFISLARR